MWELLDEVLDGSLKIITGKIIEAARAFAEQVYEADPRLLEYRGIAVLAAPFAETERVEYLDKA